MIGMSHYYGPGVGDIIHVLKLFTYCQSTVSIVRLKVSLNRISVPML